MSKTCIAIIEDDHTLAQMYSLKFKNAGFDVSLAHNGEQGLEIIKKHQPDIVLLDIRMPVMSGDEMLTHLRATDWGANIRVIVLTNISRDEAPSNLRFLSVDRYVVKAHTTPSQVVDIVYEVIGDQHKQPK